MCRSAYDGGGTKELPARSAQAGVGCERSVFGEPGADGAFRDLPVEALAQELLGFGEGVTEIEG